MSFADHGVCHVCDQPPVGEGSHTVLHRLWKVDDRVQTLDGRRWIVGHVRWNDLWCGAQCVLLHEFTDEYPDGQRHVDGAYYSRYVGCDPFELIRVGDIRQLTIEQQIAIAERRVSHTAAKHRELGPWLKQRDEYAKRRWQSARGEAAAASSELMTLRQQQAAQEKQSFEAITALAAAFDLEPEEEESVAL